MVLDAGVVGIALAAVAVLLATFSLHQVVVERHQIYRTLRAMRSYELAPPQLRDRELAPTFVRRVLLPALRRLTRLSRDAGTGGSLERIRRELAYAGSPLDWDAERILSFKLVGAIGLGILGALLGGVQGLNALQTSVVAIVGAGAGYYGPEWVLRSRGARRQSEIRRALPDALDLLAISVEAGLAFDGAMAHMTRQATGPLAEELNRVLREVQLGKSRTEAFRDLADRTSLPELKSFVLSMVQADAFGVAIGQVLKVQAREMRIKRRQRAEEQAQKIPVKIVFPLVFCILPALFVILLGPAAINIFRILFGN